LSIPVSTGSARRRFGRRASRSTGGEHGTDSSWRRGGSPRDRLMFAAPAQASIITVALQQFTDPDFDTSTDEPFQPGFAQIFDRLMPTSLGNAKRAWRSRRS
jgi:hypothetical protein